MPDDETAPPFEEAEDPNVPEPFREAVAALHEQVQTAADAIRELRAENERLRQKVEDLSERPDVSDDDAFILLDDDRADLRERIQSFIDAIDEHLETSPASGIDPEWPDEPPAEPEPSDSEPPDSELSDEMDETLDEPPENESGETSDPAASTLQDGLPDDGEFEVEVPDPSDEGEDRPTSKRSPCRDEYTSEPRTIGPGLQPRRSARRRR
ncbi:cell division protein ZapB [Longibacter salinarum]|uniref:cell division protein ZapB n=1 Tax=Longibacter salinarum TaxID=1850348 RepID=UPI00117C2F9D|nr:cell division protein ZapB [Longibacter salinarum]